MAYSSQLIFRFVLTPGGFPRLRCLLLGLLFAAVGCENDARTIHVQTQPTAASVFIDGNLAGASPCKVQWTDSRPDDLWELHVIEARARGYEPQRKEIRYRTGEAWLPERLELTLAPTNGLVMRAGESKAVSTDPSKKWTPQKEIPSANNKPPTRDPSPAPSAGVDPTEDAYSFWRPKGRPGKTAVEPIPPRPAFEPPRIESTPARREPPAAAPETTVLPPAGMREYQTTGSGRLLACEVRLVRLSDGRVLSQASLQAPYSQRGDMMELLIKLLAKDAPDEANVAVGCLSNRSRSADGRTLCDEMTRVMIRAVRQTPGLRYVKQVNLRDVILDEAMIESPKVVANRRIAYLFSGADHVILGGAATAIPIAPPVTEP